MYRKAVNYLRGQAVVRITCETPERVVNLCAAHGIPFWDVDWRTERCFRVTTTLPGLRRLRPLYPHGTEVQTRKDWKLFQTMMKTIGPKMTLWIASRR